MNWSASESLGALVVSIVNLFFLLKLLLNDIGEIRRDLRAISEKIDKHLINHAKGEFK